MKMGGQRLQSSYEMCITEWGYLPFSADKINSLFLPASTRIRVYVKRNCFSKN